MKIFKAQLLVLLFMALTIMPSSCWLFDEEEVVNCGSKKHVTAVVANSSRPISLSSFITQDATYSYYWLEFPFEITNLELCIEEHCYLTCDALFKGNLSQNLKGMKVEGMIDIGFTGHPMVFTKSANNAEFTSENDFGLKQSFSNYSYGWIYGRVKISFETYGTVQEELDMLNQLLIGIIVDIDYYEPKK